MRDKIETENILNEFLADLETDWAGSLDRYAERYPDLTEQLHERAGMARMFSLVPEFELTEEEEVSLRLRAASIVQGLIHEAHGAASQPQATAAPPERSTPNGLLERAAEIGDTAETFAKKIRLSKLIVRKLDKRQIRLETIPKLAFQKLAELLRVPVEMVNQLLSGAPVPSRGFYKSDAAPKFPSQADFAELIRYDPDLTDADKDYWLSGRSSDE